MMVFPRRMAIALIITCVLLTSIPLVVGWRFLVAAEDSMPTKHQSRTASSSATKKRQWRSLQTGYFWASVALLGVALFAALLTGWLLYRWLFQELFHLRMQLRHSMPKEFAPFSGVVEAEEPIAGLQQDLQQLLEKLLEQQHNEVFKEQVARWQDVAQRLAHEIRNPLTPILLTVQELEKQYPDDKSRYQSLLQTSVSIVREEVTSLRRIVDEFSAFAKLPQVEPLPLDLNQVVLEFLEAYNWFRERVTIEWQQHPGVLMAALDRMLFKRVLHNLIENAIEAGSPVLLIRTGELPTEEVILQIEDKGPGIPEHLQSKIFTPYFTTKQLGTGLGLSITKKIIIDHGGSITVSANPDGGSTFTIRLPVLSKPQESKTSHA